MAFSKLSAIMTFRATTLRVGMVTILGLVLAVPLAHLAAAATTTYSFASTKDVIVTEVQTASLASSGEEFIELFNTTGADIDFADLANGGKNTWKLQYFSKSKLSTLLPTTANASGWTSPFRTFSLTGVIHAGDYYVLAAEGYAPGSLDPDQTYSSTLADDGGALQLVDATTVGTSTNYGVHDRLAWSTDASLPANNALFTSPGAGASLQRLPNDDDEYVNTDGTLTIFTASSTISPKNVWQAPVAPEAPAPVEEEPIADGESTVTEPVAIPTAVSNEGLQPLLITEVLANPASPQTDAADEYIELYNPNDLPFNLRGYTLETGSTTLHDFTFSEDVIVQPGEYRAFYSADTKLSLSNSGGQVRLLDTNQAVVSQSDVYGAAADGTAWVLDPTDGVWKWSTSTSPNSVNTVAAPVVIAKATKTTTKATTTKKTAAKVKGATTTKAKKSTTKKPKAVKVAAKATSNPVRPAAPIHVAAIAAVAALGVAYMIYEYRNDLANKFYQFRTNRTARGGRGK